jgi:leucyl/phenylalanyl-tRNA--protein transferase
MPGIVRLAPGQAFPPTSRALDYPNGLLAAGGTLTPERLIEAYRHGIFPWYEAPQPVLWWTPDPRSVLYPEELHISRSLRKTLRRDQLRLTVDRDFSGVMGHCAAPRPAGHGTWIGPEMLSAYAALHRLGIAHSIEVREHDGTLAGGLYGLALGRIFFGESMFSGIPGGSRIALVALVHILRRGDFHLIDCQMETPHMNTMGARTISRLDFEAELDHTVDAFVDPAIWTLPATCGGLLS